MQVTRRTWAKLFLETLGWPDTYANRLALVAWQAAEGGPQNPPQAKFNPLNTTLVVQGSWRFNFVGVQNYPDLGTGLIATKRTLLETNDAGYAPIRRNMREGDSARATLGAVEDSLWGTGGLAYSIVDDVNRDHARGGDVFWDRAIGQ